VVKIEDARLLRSNRISERADSTIKSGTKFSNYEMDMTLKNGGTGRPSSLRTFKDNKSWV